MSNMGIHFKYREFHSLTAIIIGALDPVTNHFSSLWVNVLIMKASIACVICSSVHEKRFFGLLIAFLFSVSFIRPSFLLSSLLMVEPFLFMFVNADVMCHRPSGGQFEMLWATICSGRQSSVYGAAQWSPPYTFCVYSHTTIIIGALDPVTSHFSSLWVLIMQASIAHAICSYVHEQRFFSLLP